MRGRTLQAFAGIAALALALETAGSAGASSHREAPFITKNPKVDGTDFYIFRSYEPGREAFVTIVANYLPLQDAYGGPNYFSLDPEALYEIHVDNNGDAKEDITFQLRFKNTLRNIQIPVGPAGNTKSISVPLLNVGPISAADDSALNVIETYTLKMVAGNRRSGTAKDVVKANPVGGEDPKAFRKPVDNIGAKSIPQYEAYAAAHVYTVNFPDCATPGKVFVGQRSDPFVVNLGQTFDLANYPYQVSPTFGCSEQVPNSLLYKNVTSLILEVPIACLTGGSEVIGAWTTASMRQVRILNPNASYERPAREGGAWTQVSRLGNPLVNEVVIGLKDKDRFNASQPKDDLQFADYVTNPTLPELVEALYGAVGVRAPDVFPRTDLLAAFATGVEGVNKNGSLAEMVRLNTAIPPTPLLAQNNLGAAGCFVDGALDVGAEGCDPAGFPNGRRLGDDVVDIALRVAMGYLIPSASAPATKNLPFTDCADVDATMFGTAFPYLNPPIPGSP